MFNHSFVVPDFLIREPKMYLYQYNDNDFRIVLCKSVKNKGWELLSNSASKFPKDTNLSTFEEIQRSSISRSRREIREIALCNNFEYFATLTINSNSCDRFSLDDCQEKLRKIIKKIKRKNQDFIYLFITEKHKNGAFHFHGLVSGLDFYTNKNGYLSNSDFDTLGFNSFSRIKSKSKVSNYILKYITKDCVKNSKGTIYISSRGLHHSIRTEIPLDTQVAFTYENDYCKIKDFSIDKLSQDEKLYFLNKFDFD